MKTKTIAARTKCIVAALILSMSIGVMPVYAVQPVQETNVAVEQSQDSVEEKAAAYFANFPEDKHVVSAADFLKMVENKENICVLDIRSAEDYAAGHIEGAINLPYGKGMEETFDILPTDKTLILQCYSGQTASQTTAALRVKGYRAYNLSGGMGAEGGSGWLGAGYTLVK